MSDLEATVCDACGSESCWQGEFYCENYRSAGTVPRWRWERFEAQRRLAALHPTSGFDGTLLGAVETHLRGWVKDREALAELGERFDSYLQTDTLALQRARHEVKVAVEEWFTNVSLDDLFAVKGWTLPTSATCGPYPAPTTSPTRGKL